MVMFQRKVGSKASVTWGYCSTYPCFWNPSTLLQTLLQLLDLFYVCTSTCCYIGFASFPHLSHQQHYWPIFAFVSYTWKLSWKKLFQWSFQFSNITKLERYAECYLCGNSLLPTQVLLCSFTLKQQVVCCRENTTDFFHQGNREIILWALNVISRDLKCLLHFMCERTHVCIGCTWHGLCAEIKG